MDELRKATSELEIIEAVINAFIRDRSVYLNILTDIGKSICAPGKFCTLPLFEGALKLYKAGIRRL